MEPNLEELKVGGHVIYVDPNARQHDALVTAIWGEVRTDAMGTTYYPCINVLFVSPDENRQDSWGRQFERQTSIVHKASQPAHGFYYMMPGDTPNPVATLRS